MVTTPLTSKARALAFASLTLGVCQAYLSACAPSDDRPPSLVSVGGESGHIAGHDGQSGGIGDDAGQANDGGDGGHQDDAGAAGEANFRAAPRANFPRQLQVDTGCGAPPRAADLVIYNDGLLPLTISSARATAGYLVKGELPLQIAPLASAALQVEPPAPRASASFGDTSTGSLTFVTNEAGAPTHEVLLNTTVFGGQFVFTDNNGSLISGALPLTYLSSTACPEDVTYRVQNTGNLAFTLFGPTFPTHLAGSSTGASGQTVPPDGYVELKVTGNSASDGACSGSGELSFTVQGPFCGASPTLRVTWPSNTQTTRCTCSAGTSE
jgi:hypothetical protein